MLDTVIGYLASIRSPQRIVAKEDTEISDTEMASKSWSGNGIDELATNNGNSTVANEAVATRITASEDRLGKTHPKDNEPPRMWPKVEIALPRTGGQQDGAVLTRPDDSTVHHSSKERMHHLQKQGPSSLHQEDRLMRDGLLAKVKMLEQENASQAAKLDGLRSSSEAGYVECQELRGQVTALKQSIIDLSRTEHQVSDDVIVREVEHLAHEVQNWAVSTFRKTQWVPHLGKRLSTRIYHKMERALAPGNTKMPSPATMFQAIVAQELNTILGASGYFEPHTRCIGEAGKYLTTVSKEASQFNRWRALTNAMAYNMSDAKFSDVTKSTKEHVVENVLIIARESLDFEIASEDIDALLTITSSATKIWRVLRSQLAVFRFQMPNDELVFDKAHMNDMHGQDAPELHGKHISIAIFPRLVKRGDKQGNNMQLTNVISKARVACW